MLCGAIGMTHATVIVRVHLLFSWAPRLPFEANPKAKSLWLTQKKILRKKKWKLNPGLCQIYRSNNIEKNKVGSTIQWLVLGNSSAEEARQSERFLAKKMLRTPLLSRSARVNETKIPGDECCGIYWVEPAFFAEAPYNGWWALHLARNLILNNSWEKKMKA